MNLKSLVAIILRLMALNFLLLGAIQTVPHVLGLLGVYKRFGPTGGMDAIPWLLIGGFLSCAILLWALALPIARFVTRGVPTDLTFGSLSLVDCYTAAFIVFGLYYVCTCLSDVLNCGHYVFKEVATSPGTTWRDKIDYYAVNRTFLPFIMGVVLLVYGRSWAVTLARKQEIAPAGPSK